MTRHGIPPFPKIDDALSALSGKLQTATMKRTLERLGKLNEEKEWGWRVPKSMGGMPSGGRVSGTVWKWAKHTMSVAAELQKMTEGMRKIDKQKCINGRIENRHKLFKEGNKK